MIAEATKPVSLQGWTGRYNCSTVASHEETELSSRIVGGHGGPELSKSELEVLKAFWKAGPLSAREAHQLLTGRFGWAYTTTRTMLDRMVKKRLLGRRDAHGIFVYRATAKKVATLAGLVREFTERVLELDTVPVAALFAGNKVLSEKERRELEALLEHEEAKR